MCRSCQSSEVGDEGPLVACRPVFLDTGSPYCGSWRDWRLRSWTCQSRSPWPGGRYSGGCCCWTGLDGGCHSCAGEPLLELCRGRCSLGRGRVCRLASSPESVSDCLPSAPWGEWACWWWGLGQHPGIGQCWDVSGLSGSGTPAQIERWSQGVQCPGSQWRLGGGF